MSDQSSPVPTLAPTLDDAIIVPIGAHDLAAQREWEHHQVHRGVDRYRRSLVKVTEDGAVKPRSLADLEPGQVIARELIGPLVERIRGAQQVAFKTANETQRPTEDVWGLMLLPAETLAACTVLHALSLVKPTAWTSTAVSLGTRVQHEWEYDCWKKTEAAAEKERKATGAEFVPNLFKLMQERNRQGVNDRVFAKWSKKAPLFCKGDWATKTRLQVGTALLALLVESNAWFEVTVEWAGTAAPRRVRTFRMTDLALDWVSDRHAQNELQRPYLLPMICEPRDFQYVDAEASVRPELA